MNIFMNFVKRTLVEEGTKSEIGALGEIIALKGVKALLLSILDLFIEL